MKNKFLKYPTEPIEVWPEKKISELADEMLKISFQGRKLAEAANVWVRMLKRKNIVIWFALSGAMVPAGMRKIISYLISRRMVDVVVCTGANIYHDLNEAFGIKHYLGDDAVDDSRLRKHRIDRIYDTFADEKKFYWTDNWISDRFASMLKDDYIYSSREICYLLGKILSKEAKDKDSILVSAFKSKVPIFIPAFCDSCLGVSLMFANRRKKEKTVKIKGKEILLKRKRLIVDNLKDALESSLITEKSKQTGAILIGGGVPKNFVQQTGVFASYFTRHDKSLSYAVQISTDVPQWGGLSGATLAEAKSWGKYKPNARIVNCYTDATIALPFISHVLSEKFKKLRRDVPIFKFDHNNLKIKYERMKL